MNQLLTPPPEHDLRRSTQNRQRDELTAIVTHETREGAPRRPLVPLAAAAAVVAVVAGLAVGVPALRGDGKGAAVNGSAAEAAIELLGPDESARLGKACDEWTSITKRDRPKTGTGRRGGGAVVDNDPYQVVEAFRFKAAQSNPEILSWVVIHSRLRDWDSCGVDRHGKVVLANGGGPDQVIYQPVTGLVLGAGSYDKSIARITISVDGKPPVDAVLRHGFYYAPVSYVPIDPKTGRPAAPFVLRGYDAAGQLSYTSPLTAAEYKARRNSCYVGPDGEVTAWMSNKPKPDPKTCLPSYLWNFLP